MKVIPSNTSFQVFYTPRGFEVYDAKGRFFSGAETRKEALALADFYESTKPAPRVSVWQAFKDLVTHADLRTGLALSAVGLFPIAAVTAVLI